MDLITKKQQQLEKALLSLGEAVIEKIAINVPAYYKLMSQVSKKLNNYEK